jgi:hypothetical protein
MDYLKVPEYPQGWINDLGINPFHWGELKKYNSTLSDSEWRWLANLINAVYTPTTGLLAQIEDQKRVIEEYMGKVEAMLRKCPDVECSHCSSVVCPHNDPLHFHHDGCPSCD